MGCCGEQVNGQAGVSRLPEAFVSLTADFSMVVNSPTYLTVLTAQEQP